MKGRERVGVGHSSDYRIWSSLTPKEAPYISCMPFATTRAVSTMATTQPCAGARLVGMSTMTLGENSLLFNSCPIPAAALTPFPNTEPQESTVPGKRRAVGVCVGGYGGVFPHHYRGAVRLIMWGGGNMQE